MDADAASRSGRRHHYARHQSDPRQHGAASASATKHHPRREFYRRQQEDGESFGDFLVALREIAQFCGFCSHCSQLRDRIVTGICDEDTLRALLSDSEKALQTTISICRAQENAEQNSTAISSRIQRVSAYRRNRTASARRPTRPRWESPVAGYGLWVIPQTTIPTAATQRMPTHKHASSAQPPVTGASGGATSRESVARAPPAPKRTRNSGDPIRQRTAGQGSSPAVRPEPPLECGVDAKPLTGPSWSADQIWHVLEITGTIAQTGACDNRFI